MPRKTPKLILAVQRIAEARQIVTDQRALIEKLKAAGHPTLDAERALPMYLSALKHLEDHARRLRQKDQAKNGETVKRRDRRFATD
jgi:protein-disulfide isomerase-like protein with CxxC motif